MSQCERTAEVKVNSQQLLDGPLKHVKKAALAALLLPLASVAVAPALAQSCPSGGRIGDFVWNDGNNNGVQDFGEPGLDGLVVTLSGAPLGTDTVTAVTDTNGAYQFTDLCGGSYTVAVGIPATMQPSPANVDLDEFDNDGVSDGHGNSVATVELPDTAWDMSVDFGFSQSNNVHQPGTGTPGYWVNHPEAWPVTEITVGASTYTRAQALQWLAGTGKDKTLTMFSSLVSAKLNVLIGNDPSCVQETINEADTWMTAYPVGSNVKASSVAWRLGEPLHRLMDNYNNGMLCAPHRE